MHEVGIITRAVDLALEHALQEGASKVKKIKLRIGELSGTIPEALEFGFEVVCKGTIAENATLEIEKVPIRCSCANGCGEFEPASPIYSCPVCEEISICILGGRELDLVEIEIE